LSYTRTSYLSCVDLHERDKRLKAVALDSGSGCKSFDMSDRTKY